MMDLRTALRQGSELLDNARVADARLTAEVLLCHALGRDRSYLFAHPEQQLSENAWIHFGRYLDERIRGKPTQYITRRQEFYGRAFHVSPGVLIPRPETEHLIETALRLAPNAGNAVDAGCGSGAIAATWSLETGREAVGTDISAAALEVAAENCRRLRARAALLRCHLTSALAARSVDLFLSNPPYIPEPERPHLPAEVRDHEPAVALFGGADGLDYYPLLITEAERLLRPGGWWMVEISYRTQDRIRAMLGPVWRNVEVVADLAGLPRVMAARYTP